MARAKKSATKLRKKGSKKTRDKSRHPECDDNGRVGKKGGKKK